MDINRSFVVSYVKYTTTITYLGHVRENVRKGRSANGYIFPCFLGNDDGRGPQCAPAMNSDWNMTFGTYFVQIIHGDDVDFDGITRSFLQMIHEATIISMTSDGYRDRLWSGEKIG